VFNLVANLAYSRWRDAAPLVVAAAQASTASFQAKLAAMDAQLAAAADPAQVVAQATNFSAACGASLLAQWTQLFGDLFVRLRDGYTITPNPADAACGCSVASSGYEPSWYDRIAADTGDRLKEPPAAEAAPTRDRLKPKSKLALKALQ
jgi:hypothetical protein